MTWLNKPEVWTYSGEIQHQVEGVGTVRARGRCKGTNDRTGRAGPPHTLRTAARLPSAHATHPVGRSPAGGVCSRKPWTWPAEKKNELFLLHLRRMLAPVEVDIAPLCVPEKQRGRDIGPGGRTSRDTDLFPWRELGKWPEVKTCLEARAWVENLIQGREVGSTDGGPGDKEIWGRNRLRGLLDGSVYIGHCCGRCK